MRVNMIPAPPSHVIVASTVNDAWDRAIKLIIGPAGCDILDERGRRTREVLSLNLAVLEPQRIMSNSISCPGAPFWQDRRKMKDYVLKEWVRDDNIDGHSYTYGQVIGSQLDDIIERLLRCPESRRAVAVLRGSGEELPCMDKIQFLIRNGRLFIVSDFRSLDVAGAWPADFEGLKALQRIVQMGLGLGGRHVVPGPIVTHAASGHFYWDEVKGWGFGAWS